MQTNQYRISSSTLLYLTTDSKAVSSADLADAIAECQKLAGSDLNGLKGPIGYWDVAVYACVYACMCVYVCKRMHVCIFQCTCIYVCMCCRTVSAPIRSGV